MTYDDMDAALWARESIDTHKGDEMKERLRSRLLGMGRLELLREAGHAGFDFEEDENGLPIASDETLRKLIFEFYINDDSQCGLDNDGFIYWD